MAPDREADANWKCSPGAGRVSIFFFSPSRVWNMIHLFLASPWMAPSATKSPPVSC